MHGKYIWSYVYYSRWIAKPFSHTLCVSLSLYGHRSMCLEHSILYIYSIFSLVASPPLLTIPIRNCFRVSSFTMSIRVSPKCFVCVRVCSCARLRILHTLPMVFAHFCRLQPTDGLSILFLRFSSRLRSCTSAWFGRAISWKIEKSPQIKMKK